MTCPSPNRAPARCSSRSTRPLNPIDLYLRSGLVPMPLSFPYVIGCDLAGTVEQARARVHAIQGRRSRLGLEPGTARPPGRRLRVRGRRRGLALSDARLTPDTEAAAMALVGITAHLGLFRFGQLKSGETVYVPGGTGGVGSMVVQMAKAAGAGSPPPPAAPRRVELCRNLGADLALNYKTDDIPAPAPRVRARRSRRLVRNPARAEPRGRHPPAPQARPLDPDGRPHRQAPPAARRLLPAELRDLRLRDVQLHARGTAPLRQRDRSAAIEEGQLKPLVGRIFPLAAAADAERFLEENTLQGRRLVDRESGASPSNRINVKSHDHTMNLLTTFAGSMMEGFLPARLGPRQDRRLLLAPARAIGERQPWWHPDFEPVACDSVADFDVMMGHEIAMAISRAASRAGRRDDLARGPDGDVSLGGLLPQGMGRRVRSCLRIQHGRVERPRRA